MAWATQPVGCHPDWWRSRLGIVRGFAQDLQSIDPATQVSPVNLLPADRPRIRPYLYSDDDIAPLMRAARKFTPCTGAAIHESLVGLLAVTGLRLGETLGLDRDDVDLDEAVLIVRHGKLDNAREVPLHDTTVGALQTYAAVRDRQWPRPTTATFFVSMRGRRRTSGTVHNNFRILVRQAGLEGRGQRCRPRPHDCADVRHSLAVRTLLGWYWAGLDVDARLSTAVNVSRPCPSHEGIANRPC